MSEPIIISLSLSLSKHVLEAMKEYMISATVERMNKTEKKDLARFVTYLDQRIDAVEEANAEMEKLL